MAYLVGDFVYSNAAIAVASITVDLSGYAVQEDDYVVIPFLSNPTSGTVSETSGGATTWTLSTLYVAAGNRMAIAYAKVGGGGAISNPTFTLSAGTGMWQACVGVVRDADASTFLDTSGSYDPGSSASTPTPSLTPSTDNCLILYFATHRSGNYRLRFLPSDVVCESKGFITDGSTYSSYIVGSVQQTTKTNTQKTYYTDNPTGVRNGVIVFAIKNKSGGKIGKVGGAGISKITWLSYISATDLDGVAWGAPDSGGVTWDGTGKINSITVSGTAATRASTGITFAPDWFAPTAFNGALNTAGAWQGVKGALPFAVNLSGKLIYLEFRCDFPLSPLGAEGFLLTLTDNSGNWVAYQLAKLSSIQPGIQYAKVIDTDATPYAGSGTMNWANVPTIHFFQHRVGSDATVRSIYVRNLLALDKTTITGGNQYEPVNSKHIAKLLNGWGFGAVCRQVGAAVQLRSDVQIGDGAVETYYDATANYLTYDKKFDAIANIENAVGANALTFTIKASASDTINDIASSIVGEQEQNYVIDAASSGSANYSLVGKTFVGMAPTLLNGETFSGATFSRCGTVNTKGANLTNCTITGTTSTNAAVSVDASGSTLDGCTIDVTGTSAAYHLELGTSVTAITLPDFTFTGTPATDKVHVLKTSGTVTITISGTTSLSAGDVTSEGATVVIAAPNPTLSATVLANTRVVLWNRTTDAELDNVWITGTSWTKTITSGASSGDVLDLYAFKEGYAEAVATIIYGGVDATFAVQQATDPAIQYYRTEESITDYTTLSEFNFYSPDIYIQADDADGASTLKRLFIYYNGVLTTEDGARYMRGGITFRSPFDVVINRSVTPIAVDNVSSTQGLYFTDEATIRVTTDDGTSWIAPPSAPGSIRYAFGVAPGQVETGVSGLTGAESAKLLALSNDVNLVSIKGKTILGEGVEGDEFYVD